jgi:hypothetical protein
MAEALGQTLLYGEIPNTFSSLREHDGRRAVGAAGG